MNIILFGLMGAGKDTVAEMLIPYGYAIRKLGKYIRETANKYNYQNMPGRDLYQKYGQACREIFGENIWNEMLYESFKNEIFDFFYVIADARQLNEYDYWTAKGYIPIGVIADADIRRQRLIHRDKVDQAEYFFHDTEIQAAKCIEKCKYKIVNNGDIEELKLRIALLMKQMQKEAKPTWIDEKSYCIYDKKVNV